MGTYPETNGCSYSVNSYTGEFCISQPPKGLTESGLLGQLVPSSKSGYIYTTFAPYLIKGELSLRTKCGLYDRATPKMFLVVSLAYVRSLEGSQKAG